MILTRCYVTVSAVLFLDEVHRSLVPLFGEGGCELIDFNVVIRGGCFFITPFFRLPFCEAGLWELPLGGKIILILICVFELFDTRISTWS